MEDHFLSTAYHILGIIGGAGLLTGLACEAYNAIERRKHFHLIQKEKEAYIMDLINNYKESYNEANPLLYLPLQSVQGEMPSREIPIQFQNPRSTLQPRAHHGISRPDRLGR